MSGTSDTISWILETCSTISWSRRQFGEYLHVGCRTPASASGSNFSVISGTRMFSRSIKKSPQRNSHIADWQRKDFFCNAWKLELGRKSMNVMQHVAHRCVQTIYGEGVCFQTLCAVSWWTLSTARIWEQDRISNIVATPEYRELDNLDGEPFVFKWKIFPRAHHSAAPLRDPKVDRD